LAKQVIRKCLLNAKIPDFLTDSAFLGESLKGFSHQP
jgi:hypothetical protein